MAIDYKELSDRREPRVTRLAREMTKRYGVGRMVRTKAARNISQKEQPTGKWPFGWGPGDKYRTAI